MKLPILRILAHAMDVARAFLKLNGKQDEAWSIVRMLIDNPPLK